jgi:hypothetical protein
MAKSLEAERAALEAEETRLADRRKALEEKERTASIAALEKIGFFKLGVKRLEALAGDLRKVDPVEIEARLRRASKSAAT